MFYNICYHGPEMLLRIDPRSASPIYSQIADSIRAQIESGTLEEGSRLPGARSLAAALEVNMHTVLRAYSDLRDDGLVDMGRGRGGAVVLRRVDLGPQVDRLVADAKRTGATLAGLVEMVEERWR